MRNLTVATQFSMIKAFDERGSISPRIVIEIRKKATKSFFLAEQVRINILLQLVEALKGIDLVVK